MANGLNNSLTSDGLLGTGPDPVTKAEVGIVETREKGGKKTKHYISLTTYKRLEAYIQLYGALEIYYTKYLNAINDAAKNTGQHARGRGTHGLKHNFAQERYFQCVEQGFSHEHALQQTSLETSHFRMNETLTYTRGL